MITGLRLVHPGKGETLPPLLLLLELLALPELLELLEPLAPPVPPVPPRPAVPELLLEPVSPPVPPVAEFVFPVFSVVVKVRHAGVMHKMDENMKTT